MEKNVPLLKLIQEPWSIKTMQSSRFLCPSAFNNNTSTPLEKHYVLGNTRSRKQVAGGRAGQRKNILPNAFGLFMADVLWFPFSQL